MTDIFAKNMSFKFRYKTLWSSSVDEPISHKYIIIIIIIIIMEFI